MKRYSSTLVGLKHPVASLEAHDVRVLQQYPSWVEAKDRIWNAALSMALQQYPSWVEATTETGNKGVSTGYSSTLVGLKRTFHPH